MQLFDSPTNVRIDPVKFPGLVSGPQCFMKRLDLIDPVFGGNKIYKLKYHLQKCLEQNDNAILSFGGSFSNHLYALAGIASKLKIKSIGIVRGFEHYRENPTLEFCQKMGMELHFLSPTEFSNEDKRKQLLQSLSEKYSGIHIVPEGGTDALGVRGAEEMIDPNDPEFDFYCIGVGSGGSMSGLINKLNGKNTILGFSALKNARNLDEVINGYTKNCPKNWDLIHDYHFGGFAVQNSLTRSFKEDFEELNGFQIDPVYQVKMLLGLLELIKKDYFSNEARILIYHTGGLQASKGYEYLKNQKHKT